MNKSSNSISKYQLRQKFREIRKSIPATFREEAAQKAVPFFTAMTLFQSSTHIACYLPQKDEFDSSLLIESIWNAKKNCYLPVLSANDNSLFFVRYEYGDALRFNRYSILEPVHTAEKISPNDLDVVITPLLAFDLLGHRLGTGGGYYDRTFAFLREGEQKPQMLGLAFAVQQADFIPQDPWDLSLNGIITEKMGLYPVSS